MIKHLHMLFVALSLVSFISRILLAEFNPDVLKQKWLRIAPHVIDSLLLLTGFALVIIGSWFSADYGWIIVKFIALIVYISLGVTAMRSQGAKRWSYFAGALLCFAYIATVAVTKQALFFL
ncbi:MAG: invasion protein [Gammaproteobacteria bacterium HGW-Gammaproteobacteria-3]|nr:MAG: invasion protein [Gammaproteobacteria bacterium HGW-Gammaproteobacteria-3]